MTGAKPRDGEAMPTSREVETLLSLQERVAVITGAASGIGRETARLFARQGAQVVLADVDAAGLAETANLVRAGGAQALIVPTDVAQPDQVEALADAALHAFGRVDAWINAAGITLWSQVVDTDPRAAERLIAINMMGALWCCQAAGRVMRESGGAIVNVSSTAGDSPVPGLAVYGMAKAGMNQLTRVCAREFGVQGIRVNAVVPGWIDTPINAPAYRQPDGSIDPAARETMLTQMAALSPLGLTGEPLDISMALLYLASDASRFVTGQLLRVSGGV